jgi:hypothetical protein
MDIVPLLILGRWVFFLTQPHTPTKSATIKSYRQGPTCVLIHNIDSHHSDHGGRSLLPYEANTAVDANETNEANKDGKAYEASESHCGR